MPHTAFLLFSLFYIVAHAEDSTVTEIENAILKQCRSIRQGKLTLEAKISGINNAPVNDRVTTIWFDYDKNKVRSDVVNHWKNRDEPAYRIIQCSNCERPNYWVEYQEKPLTNAVTSITLEPLTDEIRKQRLSEIFDPRMLGIVAAESTVLKNYHFETEVNSSNREKPNLRRDRWKGEDCWVTSFHLNTVSRVFCELWVVPSRGYTVARNIMESHPGGKTYRVAVETEATPVGNSGLWFPHTCVCETTNDGKLIRKEELRVTSISLNEPIEDKVFTLAGMDIASDTPIASKLPSGESHVLTWTGASAIEHVNPVFIPKPTSQASSPSNRNRLLLAAAACAFLATVALAIFFWRRRSKPPTG
ncbi:hypothetical protein [Fimbriiglobus ruber]|uniref:hypothetical protein n=1 Tax=Fimbriiglobus ruber TaxID=1908690 RepID=UPI000B4A935A|nr:hypothetical protein [Fimbriiglobus ruber]